MALIAEGSQFGFGFFFRRRVPLLAQFGHKFLLQLGQKSGPGIILGRLLVLIEILVLVDIRSEEFIEISRPRHIPTEGAVRIQAQQEAFVISILCPFVRPGAGQSVGLGISRGQG